ncbi:MAG: TIGR04283 family arsenosugar biosynthesis glycosyltransferase [Desulfobulbus sp.]|nr:TIGR04283 family arsenosugar biosynthesis glycosyltransferase [Desulfobulbus sp.]
MSPSAHPLLSIIIPTLNEELFLPLLLGDVWAQRGVTLEVIVGDGGSADATEAAAKNGGARFVGARRGRGAQMNEAARLARGVYLLFLHADSRLEDPYLLSAALQTLREATWSHAKVAGHFGLRFQRATLENHLSYRYLEAKARLNRINTTNGDQGFLLSRQWFDALGGFSERFPFLEDQQLAERIRNQGRWITLPGELTTSARRFETEGFPQRYLSMGVIMVAFNTGLEGFFSRLPGLYRLHHHCGRLLLAPILIGFFATLFTGAQWREIGQRVRRIGRYLGENTWQPFFFIDVCLQTVLRPSQFTLLFCYDKWLGRAFKVRLVEMLIGWGAVLLFAGLVTPMVWIVEWWQRRRRWDP